MKRNIILIACMFIGLFVWAQTTIIFHFGSDKASLSTESVDTIRFKELVADADLIITGEGSADRQTLMGKLPMGILEQAGHTPVYLIAGRISDREELLNAGFARVDCINPPDITLEEAMRKEVARQNIIINTYKYEETLLA